MAIRSRERQSRNIISREQTLIQDIFAPLAILPQALGLKDDAALMPQEPGCDVVVTTDTLVAGVHFFSSDPADLVAQKALRVSLSDLAAKGATPQSYLLNLSLPEGATRAWLKRFAKGLEKDQTEFGCILIGGDMVKTPGPLTISMTAFGHVPEGQMVKRGNAKAGDLLYVSGFIGDATLGLEILRDNAVLTTSMSRADKIYFKARYRLPQPRVGLMTGLRKYANAAMDISDGLAGDLALMCAATGMTVQIMADDIPSSPAVQRMLKRQPEFLPNVLTGGDDYEILCAIAPEHAGSFQQAAEKSGVSVNQIGVFKRGKTPPLFVGYDGEPVVLDKLSYSHF